MKIKNLLFAFVLLLFAPLAAYSQTSLTATTTTAAVSASASTIQLASVSGISGFGPGIVNPTGGTAQGTGNITSIYIDRELDQVIAVNTTSKVVSVLRGVGGTQASAHASGATVLVGPASAFYNYNPEGACTGAAAPVYTPWVNQSSGAESICSSVTGTWVQGFTNGALSGNPLAVSAPVASAAGAVTPSGPLFHITGTSAITGFNIPVGCGATAVSGCTFTVVPDAAFTWTTAGNIATAGTAVINKTITFTWDAKNSKWVVDQSS